MQFFRFLQELAYDAPETGIPDDIKRRYDRTVERGVNNAWRGVLQVAASGFGKGVLIVAGVTLAAMAIGGGYMALAADTPITASLMDTFSQGVIAGFGQGMQALGSAVGMAFMALGGAFGAISDARKHHATLMAQIARERAQEYEKERDLAQKKDLELVKDAALGKEVPVAALSSAIADDFGKKPQECQHCAREAARRAQQEAQPNSGRSV